MTHENIERHLINIALEDGDKSVQFLRPILRILGQISLAQEDDVKKIVNAGISDVCLLSIKKSSSWSRLYNATYANSKENQLGF